MKSLKFNSSSAFQGLKVVIADAADSLIDEFYNDVYSSLSTQKGREGLTRLPLDEENIIKRKIIGNAYAIMDSYGTGSNIDTDNSFLDEYKSSGMWNPLRPADNSIAGRTEGEYTNIFGQTDVSSGKLAGLNLETMGKVKPQEPSYAFQNAEKWFFGGDRINQKLAEVIHNFFQASNMKKYFTFG